MTVRVNVEYIQIVRVPLLDIITIIFINARLDTSNNISIPISFAESENPRFIYVKQLSQEHDS